MSEPDLFDLAEARAAAMAGEQRAYVAADDFWKEQALRVVLQVCQEQSVWTVDAIWAAGLPRPIEGRAIAGVLRRASAKGYCVNTGRHRASKQVQCHGNRISIWRSLIYGGSDPQPPQKPEGLTPEQAWEEFEGELPRPLAPARTCHEGHRVPEVDYRYHGEELLQMRDRFLELFRRARDG